MINTIKKAHHQIAQYKYKDKLLFTTNFKDIDLDNSKYTISFNKDKTKAWHFFSSKGVFFKWKTENKKPHVIDFEVREMFDRERKIFRKNLYNLYLIKAVYTPKEIYGKQRIK